MTTLDSTLIASYISNGDVSGLDSDQLVTLYAALCAKLGLDPAFQPFSVVTFKGGKKLLYVNRGATDIMARRNGVSRRVIKEPRVIGVPSHVGGSKEILVVVCVARAETPDGRWEESLAVVAYDDPVNSFMKAETKAKRRATLAVLGLGLTTDESELESIPGVSVPQLAQTQASAALLAKHVETYRSLPEGTPDDVKLSSFNAAARDYAEEIGVAYKDARKTLFQAVIKTRRDQ